jgi:hypothetical protein
VRLTVIAGYARGDDLHVIAQSGRQHSGRPLESVLQVGADTVTPKSRGRDVLAKPLWLSLIQMQVGQEIMIGGRLWRRVGRTELDRRIGGRVFRRSSKRL